MGSSREKDFIELFEKDRKDGVRPIFKGQYIILDDSTSIYKCAKSWIILSPSPILGKSGNRKDCLLKSYIYDIDNSGYSASEQQMLKANNFILPEIAKAFGLEAASYGRFKIVDNYDDGEVGRDENIAYFKGGNIPVYRILTDKEYILTPSFLNNDEELVPFGDLIQHDKEHDVNIIWKDLEKALIGRNISKSNISQIRKQYALKSIFGAYIELNDNHNYNDGIIFTNDRSNRNARLAPAYDLDYAMRIYNFGVMGNPITFVKEAGPEKYELTDMLKAFKNDLNEKDFNKLMCNLDPDNIFKIIEDVNKKHSLNLTIDVERKYIKLFTEKYQEMEAFYKERYGKDIDD